MPISDFDEMVRMLEHVARITKHVTLPYLEKKTGLKVVDHGKDYGQIVTVADLDISKAILDGDGSFPGIRHIYPGSFSEESDDKERRSAKEIYELDPIDGTGDFVDTYAGSNVMGPTTLLAKLRRGPDGFYPVAGLILDVVHGETIVSDRNNVRLYRVDSDGRIHDVQYEATKPEWNHSKIRLNRRVSYPQLAFDGPFKRFLNSDAGYDVIDVPVGGAGVAAMQVFRNYIQPTDGTVKHFNDLQKIDICFSCQPDWKTWDTDPTRVIVRALDLPEITDIYERPLEADASLPDLKKDLVHHNGVVISTDSRLREHMAHLAERFEERNPDCPLLTKDYAYKNAIVAMGKRA